MHELYDLIIIGSGPAGLSAAIYGSRARLKTLVIEKTQIGGQILNTYEIENYPGAQESLTGKKLIKRMIEQAKSFGAEIIKDEILEVEIIKDIKLLKGQKKEYKCKTLIIATGTTPKKLGIKGEEEFISKGVSYCAICDGDFFTDLEVFVVGGGDSAVKEAIFLTKFARKVTIVYRNSNLKCTKVLEEKSRKNEKISFLFNTVIEEIKGDGILESIFFKNTITNEVNEYICKEEDGTMGLFIFIGNKPKTGLFKNKLDMDSIGYIITDENMKTSIDGVFAAGDCRSKSVRQVITASSDGAIAAIMADEFIGNK
ncbi:thioredoxin-disulfide reductase [Romboutsia maritimum]|uniref:Thioredoxin reductase n=1 Tax=Romboutsia maritimum TaxID=2020948 RepID=A0A371IVK5_9FIRM|nr:thioredoxin-disulfide reductase [Romboutsia maritimum]RDY24489.1 thioredoxin-disulfide reductase [Romboutsia maritimum]